MNSSKLEIKRIVVNPKSKKKQFIFLDKHNTQIKDPETLSRVKKLVIPPAYTDIKIANNPNNYLQAVGIDDKGRKQYVYKKSFWRRWHYCGDRRILDWARDFYPCIF